VHLAERYEPLQTFIPQHQSHAPETLQQGEPADAGELGVVASRLPDVEWCTAWVRRQKSYGVSVNTPIARPTQSLVARRWKKAPWPQSCWIKKSRTRKPAAGTASNRQSQ
jgi:hypothetical protein